jgi:hypothetical protein
MIYIEVPPATLNHSPPGGVAVPADEGGYRIQYNLTAPGTDAGSYCPDSPRLGTVKSITYTEYSDPYLILQSNQEIHKNQTERKFIEIQPDRQPSDVAIDALLKFKDLPADSPMRYGGIYDSSIEAFVKYLKDCDSKTFMIKGFDTAPGGKVLNLPMEYCNRWGPRRRSELSDKLERLNLWFELVQDRPVTMITLTCQPNGKTIPEAWDKLNESRVLLLKLIRKYFPRAEYFWVPEPHKSGYVHYHLAVFAAVDNYTRDTSKHAGMVRCRERPDEEIWEILTGQGIEDKFRDLWSKKYGTGSHDYGLVFTQKKGDQKVVDLKNYLVKYLEKGFLLKSWSHSLLLFNTFLHEGNYRAYGASKGISKIMHIADEKKGKRFVWLETRMSEPILTADNEEIDFEHVVWDRDYIPDFIDNSFRSIMYAEAQTGPNQIRNAYTFPFWQQAYELLDLDESDFVLWNESADVNYSREPKDPVYHYTWGRGVKGLLRIETHSPDLTASEQRLISKEESLRQQSQKDFIDRAMCEQTTPEQSRRNRNKNTAWN